SSVEAEKRDNSVNYIAESLRAENKLSAGKAIETLALPKQAVFPLSQHIGAPATAIVKKGDVVKVGTKIAEAGGFVSAAIFSSVSGKVN
ncbi:hypothetical protein OSL60_26360, partial [Escherichia coli]|nr:hypothetical protein [Escherichia coli]